MTDSRPLPETGPATSAPAPDDASAALELHGADVLALLHRVSTQKLDDLTVGEARLTLFCDFRGRLLHRVAVARTQDAVWLVQDDAPGAALAAFVDRQVFRDDVKIHDRSAEFAVVALASTPDGPAGVIEPPRGPMAVAAGDGVVLVLTARGSGAPRLDRAARERARISLGRPGHGREIVAEYNPFEVGLGGAVHLDKGCFTGQESLMRLVTYDSVRRQMVRVTGAGSAPAVPAEISGEAGSAGTLTSAIDDESPGRWLGLAVLRHEFVEAGRPLEVDGRALAEVHRLEMRRALGRP
jgi:folate-binding protein YgfZ